MAPLCHERAAGVGIGEGRSLAGGTLAEDLQTGRPDSPGFQGSFIGENGARVWRSIAHDGSRNRDKRTGGAGYLHRESVRSELGDAVAYSARFARSRRGSPPL